MRINDNNCVDKAENVIKKLVEDSKQKYRGKIGKCYKKSCEGG